MLHPDDQALLLVLTLLKSEEQRESQSSEADNRTPTPFPPLRCSIQVLFPGIWFICHCFMPIFPFNAMTRPESAALLPSSSSFSRLQPAQQNPLSKLTISSWSFACFLTSGRRQAQAEIIHTQTHREPRPHSPTQDKGETWLGPWNKEHRSNNISNKRKWKLC